MNKLIYKPFKISDAKVYKIAQHLSFMGRSFTVFFSLPPKELSTTKGQRIPKANNLALISSKKRMKHICPPSS